MSKFSDRIHVNDNARLGRRRFEPEPVQEPDDVPGWLVAAVLIAAALVGYFAL